jgi:hypothetical protein
MQTIKDQLPNLPNSMTFAHNAARNNTITVRRSGHQVSCLDFSGSNDAQGIFQEDSTNIHFQIQSMSSCLRYKTRIQHLLS